MDGLSIQNEVLNKVHLQRAEARTQKKEAEAVWSSVEDLWSILEDCLVSIDVE